MPAPVASKKGQDSSSARQSSVEEIADKMEARHEDPEALAHGMPLYGLTPGRYCASSAEGVGAA